MLDTTTNTTNKKMTWKWSSPDVTGSQPPSITGVVGMPLNEIEIGFYGGWDSINEATPLSIFYVLNIKTWHWTNKTNEVRCFN